jgi:autotransporter-associated beta strand protein
MRKLVLSLLVVCQLTAVAAERDIDISGNNTSSDYKSYSTSFTITAGDTVNVKMARYCYFSSTISGKGILNLYAGGERSYLGTEKGKAWPNWNRYTGDIHIWPFPENSSSAGFYGVVLAHGSKSSSAENAIDDATSGKVNPSMANNHVTLHKGAVICCEANTSGAGFRIGELNTEEGSTLQGYMKNQRAAYYLLGGLNTDFTIAGTIMPSSYRDDTSIGIVKEGTGVLSITGNDNYVSGALRVLQGRVNIMNDRAAAQSKKLRGGLGAMPSNSDAIAYVFEGGVLGGIGSIGGTVDNYGTVEPGTDAIGLLTLKNYAATKDANLVVRPTSMLRFKVASAESYDQLSVDGAVKYVNMMQDFTTSDKMPVIEVVLADGADLSVGDELRVLTAKSKAAADWQFDVKANHYTWAVEEREEDGGVVFVLRVVSKEDAGQGGGDDNPDNPVSTMGAFYDDGIDDAADKKTLRYYADMNDKSIGVALCTYKGLQSDRDESGRQFNMMVCENEMKPEALQPSQGSFSFGSADNLVTFAKNNNMTVRGHCLVWHSQLPTWMSSDGKKNDKGWTRQQALDIMKTHITKVVQHFKGKVREWDVVNECLDDNQTTVRTNPDSYDLRQQSVWQLAIGDDYVDSAFVFAHRADPDALLYLNDYGVELQGKAKSVAFYNLAVRLKNAGIPIDGVGLQCHFSVGDVDSVKLANTVSRFADAGLKCIITELDMGISSTTAQNLEEQARNYRVVTDIVLNNDNCPSMVVWGIKDNDSWREASSPLLYTSGLDRKPAWYAVRSALRHRTLTDTGIHGVTLTGGERACDDGKVYDLHGRQVAADRLKPGLYISNGSKFVVR